MNIKEKFWVGTFISLWVLVSTVSTFHSVEFFGLSNNAFFSWCVAIGFEIGAMASLGGMLIGKGNKTIIWLLFIILTAFQIHGNMYYAWTHAGDLTNWTNLFDLGDEDINYTKRIFSFVSGGILPLISLGFIKSLMDYLKPKDDAVSEPVNDAVNDAELDDIIDNISDKDLVEGEYNPEDFEDEKGEPEVESISKLENLAINLETKKVEGGDTIKVDTAIIETEPVHAGPELEALNTKRVPSNLGDVIEKAENTVNSIGEK
jgi:hypothetical protein